jgi:hypothetical protein
MHKTYVTLTADHSIPFFFALSSLESESMVCQRQRTQLSPIQDIPTMLCID